MKKDVNAKIMTLSELSKLTEQLHKQGKTIAHCHGVFDLLHPGHIKHLETAKEKSDILIVTITKDQYVNKGPGRPIFNQNLRAESIAAFECVDYVAINDSPTAVEAIKKLKPTFYVKGNDYSKRDEDITGKIYAEERAVRSVGGSIIFTDEISFSSSKLINTFLIPYPEEAKDFFHRFKKHLSADDIIKSLRSIKDVRVLVIGDIIIDEYHYCVGMGKSQKDNIIATKFLNAEVFAGGSLAAANHIAGFCSDVTLLSCVGEKNSYNGFIKKHLKPNIKTKFYSRNDAYTVVKRRFVDPAFLNKLFELCYLDDINPMPASLENQICAYLKKNLKSFDMVLVTDFGHGLITNNIIKALCENANFLAVNVQTNSANIGYNLITRFPRADYICIDEPELRLACHDRFSNIEKLIRRISKDMHCDHTIITRGHRGSLTYSSRTGFKEVPVFSKEVIDRIGAGDAFFSITAPCVYKKIDMEEIGFIGNAVGALKVLIVGNRSSVEPVPLYKYISTMLK